MKESVGYRLYYALAKHIKPFSRKTLKWKDVSTLIVKVTFCKHWTTIKMKISMTCLHREYKVKNGSGAGAIAKTDFFIGL